jgi:hypothetical protein
MYWIYNIPAWLLGVLVVGAFLAFAGSGVLLTRPAVAKRFGKEEGWGEHVSIILEAAFVFIGLLMALVTIAAYDNFAEARNKVASEASEVGTLYRDVTAFPDPPRSQVEGYLATYVDTVINTDWPEQQRGVLPSQEPEPGQVLRSLASFEPASAGATNLQQATLAQVNAWLKARRDRIDLVTRGLPADLWVVLVLGAVINIGLTWLLPVRSVQAHLILSWAFAAVVGLLLFVTASMDHPFRGTFSVSPEAFHVIQRDVIGSHPSAP